MEPYETQTRYIRELDELPINARPKARRVLDRYLERREQGMGVSEAVRLLFQETLAFSLDDASHLREITVRSDVREMDGSGFMDGASDRDTYHLVDETSWNAPHGHRARTAGKRAKGQGFKVRVYYVPREVYADLPTPSLWDDLDALDAPDVTERGLTSLP